MMEERERKQKEAWKRKIRKGETPDRERVRAQRATRERERRKETETKREQQREIKAREAETERENVRCACPQKREKETSRPCAHESLRKDMRHRCMQSPTEGGRSERLEEQRVKRGPIGSTCLQLSSRSLFSQDCPSFKGIQLETLPMLSLGARSDRHVQLSCPKGFPCSLCALLNSGSRNAMGEGYPVRGSDVADRHACVE